MPVLRTKTLWKTLAGAAVAASLVVAPLVATGASAADLIGTVGTLEEATPEANSPKYWEERYAAHDADCYNSEGSSSHGKLTDGGKTVTLYPYQDSWPGDHWEVLVIKAGNTNNVIEHPSAGVAYASPENNGGNQATVSHWIVCKGTAPETPPTVVTPSLDYTDPSCLAAGQFTQSSNVDWTSVVNPDGSTTWTAAPKPGTVFAPGTKTTWTVPNLAQLPVDHELCKPDQPPAEETSVLSFAYDCESATVTVTTVTTTTPYVWDGKSWVPGASTDATTTEVRDMTAEEKMDCPLPARQVEYSAWEDGEWTCGDTQVTQTREVTTTVYEYDEQGNVTASSSVATESQTRELTESEIGECPLLPGDILSSCVGDVPYLSYGVDLPEGYTPDSENPVTITFVNPDGEDYVVTGQALSGTLLWPGASAAAPQMWPGWALVDGEYVETDGNFAWTREGVTVRFDVNPTYETVVEYPEATALCANPPIGGSGSDGEEPGSDEPAAGSGALAVTGGGVSPLVPVIGGAALLAGLAALAIVAYRRRQDAA